MRAARWRCLANLRGECTSTKDLLEDALATDSNGGSVFSHPDAVFDLEDPEGRCLQYIEPRLERILHRSGWRLAHKHEATKAWATRKAGEPSGARRRREKGAADAPEATPR